MIFISKLNQASEDRSKDRGVEWISRGVGIETGEVGGKVWMSRGMSKNVGIVAGEQGSE